MNDIKRFGIVRFSFEAIEDIFKNGIASRVLNFLGRVERVVELNSYNRHITLLIENEYFSDIELYQDYIPEYRIMFRKQDNEFSFSWLRADDESKIPVSYLSQQLTFEEYQKAISTTAIYPNVGNNYIYPLLGLCGETGEIAEKFKKLIRDNNGEITDEFKASIKKEMGDVLWYQNALAKELGFSLNDVAQTNIDKLLSRKKKGTLQGSGDDR